MQKIVIAISLVLMLTATAAQPAHATSVVGSDFPGSISATISTSLSGSTLRLDVSNTSSLTSYLTALAFEVPTALQLSFGGAFNADDTPLVYAQNKKTYEWSFGAVSVADVSDRLPVQPYNNSVNYGLFTNDKNWLGGDWKLGIAKDSSAYFLFTVTGSFTELDPFLARFQSVWDGDSLDGSDLATPTPIPGAVWLFGTGLVGLVGLRRFRL